MMRRHAPTLCVLLSCAGPAFGTITAEILTIGFPGEGEQKYVYRGGAYAAVGVRLSMTGEDARQVIVHLEQHDRDGDIIYTEKSIALTPDLEGAARAHWLYFVPNPVTVANGATLTLQVLDEEGQTVLVTYNGQVTHRISPPDYPEVLDDGSFLVLSISNDTAGKVRKLSDSNDEGKSEFARPVRVAHISPDLVPDHWIGLEMVDAIVWDAADPTQLSPDQISAILEWVRNGGRLLLAAGDSEDKLATSDFKDYLPVQFSGVKAVTALPAELPGASWGTPARRESGAEEVEYPKRIQVAQCKLRQGAAALVQSPGGTQTYLARNPLDSGSITCLALTLRDLFSLGGDDGGQVRSKDFFRKVLMLRRSAGVQEQQQGFMGGFNELDLFGRMHGFIGFRPRATWYMVIAILFVFAYVSVATVGSWIVLGRRNLRQHSWSAFFVVALAASGIGVLSVQAIQGFGTELHQLTIVDSNLNTYSASAHSYFGIKTGTFVQDVDLWLPAGRPDSETPQRSSLILRPLSPRVGAFSPEGGFADTKRYEAQPSRAALEDVPIRATLKQFEGYWRGTMDGQVAAKIGMRRNPVAGEPPFLDGSTITNNLSHDLVNCYLFEAQGEVSDAQGARKVNVHPLGSMAAGETVDVVQRMTRLTTNTGRLKYPQDFTLKEFHKDWVGNLEARLSSFAVPFGQGPFENLTQWQSAVLVLTTFQEYEPEIDPNAYYQPRLGLLQTNCRRLDRSDDLGRSTLLLVGFAPQAGPVTVYARRGDAEYNELRPGQTMTVYRISIPVAERR